LKDYYSEITEAERGEREEFVVDACYLMRDSFRGEEVYETLGLKVKECAEWVDTAPLMIQFRSHLFSRLVPIVKDIGLWGPRGADGLLEVGCPRHVPHRHRRAHEGRRGSGRSHWTRRTPRWPCVLTRWTR
jgi:hypothetical protein